MTQGSRAGTIFRLRPDQENRLGRGLECGLVLADPLCSRVHAVLTELEHRWWVRDAESRNGTFVNDQRIDDAALVEGSRIRVGSTEFIFHLAEEPPSGVDSEAKITQTLVRDQVVAASEAEWFSPASLGNSRQAHELLLLYQLSLKLLGTSDPDEVVHIALDLLRERCNAAVVGFLWVNETGQLRPKLVIPAGAADQVHLSDHLTELVCRQNHAVWVDSQRASTTSDSLQHFADAICVPLVQEGTLRGALHAYREHNRFTPDEFQFTLSLANILGIALVRARREATLATDFQQLAAQSPGYDEMVGESPQMRELKARIDRLARATGCVLIRGESGTGKELVARAIQRRSPRADQPLLTVNCAAIPADLIESQLFGHKAGSFTGADRDHIGYFQQADSGTLFLDEVGELTLEGQAKLLRILEGHPFQAVGGTVEISVDVRVIAATNQNLETYVREHRFRQDLYYRLSVFELFVPPLRERGDDIQRLIEAFLAHYRLQHGRPSLELSEPALKKLLAYHWPGNVRQLRNVIDSAVVLADGKRIEPQDLGLRDTGGDGAGSLTLGDLNLEDMERQLIAEALKRTAGNVNEAARLLGIGRATLYRKMDEDGVAK
ncbi:MAG: sigma 54-interacting transcriptional regulator [Planctomycetia bacterium]|nr:sigma 54-interacting transcriptional regulator [Planctomycetia bacterium]